MPLCGDMSVSDERATGIVPDYEDFVAYPCGGVGDIRGASMTGVAGQARRGRSRISLVWGAVLLGGKECGGKKCVASGVRWQEV